MKESYVCVCVMAEITRFSLLFDFLKFLSGHVKCWFREKMKNVVNTLLCEVKDESTLLCMYDSFTVNRITRWKPALAHLCSSTLYLWISRPKLGWRRFKGAEWRICSPVTAMLLPLALLFLTSQARGSPTLVELINSGLSIIGAKYVPPESQETVVVTRQSSCRDCSRQVCNTSDQTASQTACTYKYALYRHIRH